MASSSNALKFCGNPRCRNFLNKPMPGWSQRSTGEVVQICEQCFFAYKDGYLFCESYHKECEGSPYCVHHNKKVLDLSRRPAPFIQSNPEIYQLFEKVLTPSDVRKCGRLVVPKKQAESYLPPISNPEGGKIVIRDTQGKDWGLNYRFWTNNNSKMYVLEGMYPYISSLNLQAGDIVTFSRSKAERKLIMGYRKAEIGSSSHQAIDLTTNVSNEASEERAVKPRVTGRPTYVDNLGGDLVQYVRCEECRKWRKIPAHLQNTQPAWTCSQDQGSCSSRWISSCSEREVRIPEEIKYYLSRILRLESICLACSGSSTNPQPESAEEQPVISRNSNGSSKKKNTRKPRSRSLPILIEGHGRVADVDEGPRKKMKTINEPLKTVESQAGTTLAKISQSANVHAAPAGSSEIDTRKPRSKALKTVQGLDATPVEDVVVHASSSRIIESGSQQQPSLRITEGRDLIAEETAPVKPTSKHPRHKIGCTCIVCIQAPSGSKHPPSCRCDGCMTVRRRSRTMSSRRRGRKPSGNTRRHPTPRPENTPASGRSRGPEDVPAPTLVGTTRPEENSLNSAEAGGTRLLESIPAVTVRRRSRTMTSHRGRKRSRGTRRQPTRRSENVQASTVVGSSQHSEKNTLNSGEVGSSRQLENIPAVSVRGRLQTVASRGGRKRSRGIRRHHTRPENAPTLAEAGSSQPLEKIPATTREGGNNKIMNTGGSEVDQARNLESGSVVALPFDLNLEPDSDFD